MIERTLVIVKPDGVLKRVQGDIKQRYFAAGLNVVCEQRIWMSIEKARKFYSGHRGKFFFEGLILSMSSGESIAMVLEGEDAIAVVRQLNGATDPAKAEPGTIRHDFRSAGGPFNTVHASDSPEAFLREKKIIFPKN